MRFVRSDDREMRAGLTLDYRLQPIPLLPVPVGWQSRIDRYDPPNDFHDIQSRGPYRSWDHHHTFEAVAGGALVRDEVAFQLPLGPLGGIAHRLAVRTQLTEVFRFRARTIESIFEAPQQPSTGRTIAVAGGTGFVGGGIARELHRRGHRVIILSHRGDAGRGLPDDIEIRAADVTGERSLAPALAGVDALVIALAFRNSPIESPRHGQTFEAIDAVGTERLVAAAQRGERQGRLSTCPVQARRRTPRATGSGQSGGPKRRFEAAISSWTIIRPTWIFGPRDVSLNRFLGFARSLPFVPLTNTGRQLLAPVFIDDAARLAADSLEDPAAACRLFELGGPEVRSMREIIAALRAARIRRPILPGPTPLLKLAAWPLQLLPEPPLTPDAVDFVNQPAVVDTAPLLKAMPRRLMALEEALATYLGPGTGPASLEMDGRLV